MFHKPLLALALVALAVPAAIAARAESVDKIVAKHFEAMGGAEKLKKVQTWRFTGTMGVGPGMEAPFVMERKRPGKNRLEFTFSGMTGIRAFDGKAGWQLMPFMGKKDPEPLDAAEVEEALEEADFDGPLMDWKSKGHALELVGTEQVEGADAFKLKLTKKNGRVEYHYLDAETYLAVKQEAKRKVRGTELEGESYLSDYKEVGGFLMPFSVTQGAKGHDRRQTMTFEKIEFDVELDDARFAMPAVTAPADTAKTGKPEPPKKDR